MSRLAATLVAVTVLAATTAGARADAARVDWAAGLLVADGIGVASRAAPTPASARGPARRAAEDAARRQLLAALPALPLATGGTVGANLNEAVAKSAIEAALASAVVLAAEPGTDGSWTVTLGLPLEAVRQALAKPRTIATSDAAVPVVIVEGVTAKPALGYRVGTLEAATIWRADVPAWAKQAPRVKARSATSGEIRVKLPANATAATLFVIVTAR